MPKRSIRVLASELFLFLRACCRTLRSTQFHKWLVLRHMSTMLPSAGVKSQMSTVIDCVLGVDSYRTFTVVVSHRRRAGKQAFFIRSKERLYLASRARKVLASHEKQTHIHVKKKKKKREKPAFLASTCCAHI